MDVKRTSLALTLALLAVGSWWLSRNITTPEIAFDAKPRHDPDYTIENFNATVMDERGHRRHSLAAKLLIHYSDDGSAVLDYPYLIQYKEGAAAVHTRADKGWMPKDAGEILMTGNVQAAQGRDPRSSSSGGDIKAESMKIFLNR